jgi:hypothetical protein
MIRDRKMYVVPTPFRLANGLAHQRTLILPNDLEPGNGFVEVGQLVRREADHLVAAYTFDLRANNLKSKTIRNPHAGREHHFRAWRMGRSGTAVVMAKDT